MISNVETFFSEGQNPIRKKIITYGIPKETNSQRLKTARSPDFDLQLLGDAVRGSWLRGSSGRKSCD
jgi:hypothetical protein